jgi:aryl-alcohol dehydrogenase-like predicted oxidoreductase
MKHRRLGQTDLQVSEIAIGAFPLSGRWTNSDGSVQAWTGSSDEESIALIHRAEELGINLIDTAEGYGSGHSEEVIGRALADGRRDRWIVATKVQPNAGLDRNAPDPAKARARILQAAEASLRRLGTDRIDLYQLHASPFDWARLPVMQALCTLKQQGKVRWYGISTNNRDAAESLQAHGPIHLMQIGYNLLDRSAEPLLDWCHAREIGTLIRVPLAKGMLTGKYFGGVPDLPPEDVRYQRFTSPEATEAFRRLPELAFLAADGKRTMPQAALRFILDNSAVSTVLAGAKTVAQIEENAGSSEVPPFTPEERTRAFEVADSIPYPRGIS